MATATWTVTKQMITTMTTVGTGGGAANPGDLHVPLGRWHTGTGLSWTSRALMYAPVSFSGMTAINEARLYFRSHTSAGFHARGNGGNSGLNARLKTTAWTETSHGGSAAVDELWGNNGGALVQQNFLGDLDGTVTRDTQTADGTDIYIPITNIVKRWFAGQNTNNGVMVWATQAQTDPNHSFEFYSRHAASHLRPYIWIDYSTNTPPVEPINLSPTGNQVLNSLTPTFSGTRSDPDGNNLNAFQIIVYLDDTTTVKWDSGTIAGSGTTFSRVYGGSALTGNTFYRWKARTRDTNGAWGPYSTQQRFKVNSVPNAPTRSIVQTPLNSLKTLTPTFQVTHSDPDASDTKMSSYQIEVTRVSDGAVIWNSGTVSVSPAAASIQRVYNGPALAWGTAYNWKARTTDSNGATGSYSSNQQFTTHKTLAPISLSPDGATGTTLTPTFIGSRGQASDTLTQVQIEVYAADGTTLIWDSTMSGTGVSASSFSRVYAGTTLSYSTSYKWRARATGAEGGVSDWTTLRDFTTKAATSVEITAPIGEDINDLTPNIDFERTDAFGHYQIQVRRKSDQTSMWDLGTTSAGGSVTSRSITYAGTALEWSVAYEVRVRVSDDGGSTWGDDWTAWTEFVTLAAGVAVLVAPRDGAWLGSPYWVWPAETLDGVNNGSSTTSSLDESDFDYGHASVQLAVSGLGSSSSSYSYIETDMDLSDYGARSRVGARIKASSLTNIDYISLRFTFATTNDWVEYEITPSDPNVWEETNSRLDTVDDDNGTIDWSNVTRIGIHVRSGGGSVTSNIKISGVYVGPSDGIEPSFDIESTGAEDIDDAEFEVYAANGVTLLWTTMTSGDGTIANTQYSGPTLTPGTTYRWRARYVRPEGPVGAWSQQYSFVLNAPPSISANRTPAAGFVSADDLTPDFVSTFADADVQARQDAPTAMEVEVRQASNDSLMHRLWTMSGLTAASNSITRSSEGSPLVYETEYKWRVRYADRRWQYGAWSGYNSFKPSESPSVTITSPSHGGNIGSPSFTVAWNYSSPGSKSQMSFFVYIFDDLTGEIRYQSGRINQSATSHIVPGGFLVNDRDYEIRVFVWDVDDLIGIHHSVTVHSEWDAPPQIEGVSATAFETTSIVTLEWEQTSLTDDFVMYRIYRRKAGEGEFVPYDIVTTVSTVTYNDLYAGNATMYEYAISVIKSIPGDVSLESPLSDAVSVIMNADVWYVIPSTHESTFAMELPVSQETHQSPIQQEVFEPLGSTRKVVVRGNVMGAEGQLDIVWQADEVPQAQATLDHLVATEGPHILKSPFGDVWLVDFAGPSKKYLSGGHLQVTLQWIEVE